MKAIRFSDIINKLDNIYVYSNFKDDDLKSLETMVYHLYLSGFMNKKDYQKFLSIKSDYELEFERKEF